MPKSFGAATSNAGSRGETFWARFGDPLTWRLKLQYGHALLFEATPATYLNSILPEQSFATRIGDGKICNNPVEMLLPSVPDQVFHKQSAHAPLATATQALKFGRDDQSGLRRSSAGQSIYRPDTYQLAVQEGSLGKLLASFLIPLSREPGSRFADRGRKIASVAEVDGLGIQAVLELLHFATVTFLQWYEVNFETSARHLSGVATPWLPGFDCFRRLHRASVPLSPLQIYVPLGNR